MRSINRATLIGNVGQSPTVKTFEDGNKLVSFSVATSDSWKDKTSGEWKSHTTWHRVVIKSPVLSDIAEKYISKGSYLYLEGKIEDRTYTDKNNIERTIHEIVVYPNHQLIILNKEKEDQKPLPYEQAPASVFSSIQPAMAGSNVVYTKPKQSSNIMEHVAYQDIDDEISF